MTPKIYIIIVTYNSMKWAQRCFSSLQQSSVPLNCIVVDNGSTDGTQEFITNNFPEVKFVQFAENLGFGKANNLGIEMAYKNGAEFFYLMNQDAWLFEDSIQKLIDVYNSFPTKEEVGILSPMHLDGTMEKLDIFLDKYIAHNFENRLISDLYLNNLKPSYEISFINAAHWFLPKDTIEKVGGFNPYFFHYGEDNEFVNRLHFNGKKIFLCPKSNVVHDGIQDLKKVDYTKYADLGIETNILNPNLQKSLKQELCALKQSILKNVLQGKFQTAKNLKKKYNKIVEESVILEGIRAKVSQKGSQFLNI